MEIRLAISSSFTHHFVQLPVLYVLAIRHLLRLFRAIINAKARQIPIPLIIVFIVNEVLFFLLAVSDVSSSVNVNVNAVGIILQVYYSIISSAYVPFIENIYNLFIEAF